MSEWRRIIHAPNTLSAVDCEVVSLRLACWHAADSPLPGLPPSGPSVKGVMTDLPDTQDLRPSRPSALGRAITLLNRDDRFQNGQAEPRQLLPFRHVE